MERIQVPNKKEELTKEEINKLHDFYTVETSNNRLKNIHIDRLKMVNKLRDMGYLRYDLPDGNSQFVYVHDNIIELTSEQKIKDAFEDYILALPPRIYENVASQEDGAVVQVTITARMIQEVLYKNLQSYFSVLDRLRPDRPITLMSDTKTEKYFYFQNTAVRVTPEDIELVPYSHLDHKIWGNSVIKRPFSTDNGKGDFEKFIEDIAGTEDADRKKSLMSILGYLMHDFYECDLRAAFFTDVNKDTAGKAAGGTGKGIIGKSLCEMLNHDKTDSRYTVIGGKNIDLSRDTRYSLADMTTQLIHLEDVNKHFDLKTLYNDITDGASIRKPYQIKPIVRPIKMMISINHTIELDGSSDLRRLIIFELANYYNDKFRPSDKFGKRFFESEWTTADWNQFYTFMCRCALTYLHDGLIDPGEVNYSERRLAESVNEDFRYWFDELISPALIDNERREYVKNSLFEIFTAKYPAYANMKFRNPFTKWCKKFCELKHIPYVEKRSTNDMLIINPTREDFLTQKK